MTIAEDLFEQAKMHSECYRAGILAGGAIVRGGLDRARAINAELAAWALTLHATLEGRSVVLMGPHSPFWRCQFCDVMQTTPINFPHKSDCLLHYKFTYGDKGDGAP